MNSLLIFGRFKYAYLYRIWTAASRICERRTAKQKTDRLYVRKFLLCKDKTCPFYICFWGNGAEFVPPALGCQLVEIFLLLSSFLRPGCKQIETSLSFVSLSCTQIVWESFNSSKLEKIKSVGKQVPYSDGAQTTLHTSVKFHST